MWAGSVILALALGVSVATWAPGERWITSAVQSLRAPRVAWQAWRTRRALPSLDIGLKLAAYQEWRAAGERLLREGVSRGLEDCVMTEVSAGATATTAWWCPIYADRADEMRHPSFALTAHAEGTFLGMRSATLVPATPQSVLGSGFLEMLKASGFDVPARSYVHIAVNGSPWGIYAMEEDPAETLSRVGEIGHDRVAVSFDATAYRTATAVVPEASFAYARPAVWAPAATPRVGRDDDPLDVTEIELVQEAAIAEARELLALWERGDIAPAEAIDAEMLGRLAALSALWYGVRDLDWQELILLYDAEDGRFRPWMSGWTPNDQTPLPGVLIDDPEIQRATARWLVTYADAEQTTNPPGIEALEELYVALGGAPGGLQAQLDRHRATIRERVSPTRTLLAEITREPADIRLHLRAVLPFPVEVLALDFGSRGAVELDPAWVAFDSGVLVGQGDVILPARLNADPVEVVLRIPLISVPQGVDIGRGTTVVTTRLYGQLETIWVPVQRAGEWGSVP